jgi:hypothetical protein
MLTPILTVSFDLPVAMDARALAAYRYCVDRGAAHRTGNEWARVTYSMTTLIGEYLVTGHTNVLVVRVSPASADDAVALQLGGFEPAGYGTGADWLWIERGNYLTVEIGARFSPWESWSQTPRRDRRARRPWFTRRPRARGERDFGYPAQFVQAYPAEFVQAATPRIDQIASLSINGTVSL